MGFGAVAGAKTMKGKENGTETETAETEIEIEIEIGTGGAGTGIGWVVTDRLRGQDVRGFGL